MQIASPTQPLGYRALIKTSLHLYCASFTRIILLALLLSIATFIPRLLSDLIGQDIFRNLPLLSPHRIWMVAVELVSLMFFIGIIWRMKGVLTNLHEPLIEDIRVGFKKLYYVVVASILQTAFVFAVAGIILGIQLIFHYYEILFSHNLIGMLITCFLFAAQVALVLYISTLFLFIIPLIALENDGILAALEDSISLVWNHWWRVFSVQYTPWLIYIIFLAVLRGVFHIDIHFYFYDKAPHTLSSTLINLACFALFIPWVAALLLLQLNDLEIRKAAAANK